MNQVPEEMLPVVDEYDRVLGEAPRSRVHAERFLHRAVHILVFDPQNRLYLQKRSAIKDTYPGMWTSSASGHVDPGESYGQAAHRELKEELGLSLELHPVAKLTASLRTGHEFTMVYVARTDQEPRPDPVEISEGRFFTWDEALALARDPARGCPSLLAVLEIQESPPQE